MAATSNGSAVKVDQTKKMKPPKKYSQALLLEAIHKIQNGEISLHKASKVFGIPYATLGDKIRGRRAITPAPKFLLTSTEEEHLCQWITDMANRGFGKTRNEIRDVVKQILDGRNAKTKSPDNRPSKQWMISFFQRHPELSLMTPRARGKERALVSATNLTLWFQEMKTYMDNADPSLLSSSDRIFNADEMGFSVCPKSKKIVADKDSKVVHNLSSGNITVMACLSAAGEYIPPLIIFPYKHTPTINLLAGFEEAYMQITPNGWITSSVFLIWLRDCFVPAVQHKKKPVVLFVDGHSYHSYQMETSEFCSDNGIIIYCLKSHASHLTQPLDQSFFSALKSAWENEDHKFMTSHGESVSLESFSSVLKKAWDIAASPDIAVSGFSKSGLFPYNPQQVLTSEKLASTSPSLSFNLINKTLKTSSANTLKKEPATENPLKINPASSSTHEATHNSLRTSVTSTPVPSKSEPSGLFSDSLDKLHLTKQLLDKAFEWGKEKTERMWEMYVTNGQMPDSDSDFTEFQHLVHKVSGYPNLPSHTNPPLHPSLL